MTAEFKTALENARKELEANGEEREAISLLIEHADTAEQREEIKDLITTGFDVLKNAAKQSEGEDATPDAIPYTALVRLVGMLEERYLAPVLLKELTYVTDNNVGHELHIAGGAIAISLAGLSYIEAIPALETFLKNYEYRYAGEEFILQIRYALWLLKKDTSEPLAYLKSPETIASKGTFARHMSNPGRSLGWVAATLADLNSKGSLDFLKEFHSKITNPVTSECFFEALQRLEKQTNVPSPRDRMCWLFGGATKAENALGVDTDNQFVIRAREKTGNKELGWTSEADASSRE